MPDIATVQKRIDPLFPSTMGVRLTVVEPERIVAELDVRPDLCTGGNILHGGAYMAFADALMGPILRPMLGVGAEVPRDLALRAALGVLASPPDQGV